MSNNSLIQELHNSLNSGNTTPHNYRFNNKTGVVEDMCDALTIKSKDITDYFTAEATLYWAAARSSTTKAGRHEYENKARYSEIAAEAIRRFTGNRE